MLLLLLPVQRLSVLGRLQILQKRVQLGHVISWSGSLPRQGAIR